MEQNKNKKMLQLGIILLFVIFSTSLATSLAIPLFNNSDNSNNNQIDNQQTIEDCKNEQDQKANNDADINNEDIYTKFANNLANSNRNYSIRETVGDDGGYYTLTAQIQDDNTLKMKVEFTSSTGPEQRIIAERIINEKVINMSLIHVGNGADMRLFFVRENGTVGNIYMYIDGIGDNIENVANAKNIVSIQQGTIGDSQSSTPVFIDIDGNKIIQ